MNNKITTLLSDVDGVYADWLDGFINYCDDIGHKALHNKPTDFGMTDIFPTLDKPWEHIMDYQHTPHYEKLKAYPEAQSIYNRLYDMGVEIIFISSCGTTNEIINARTAMLEREANGKFSDIITLPLGASKTEVLKKFPRAAFIDDQFKMALEGAECGHDSFLRNMPYNKNEEHESIKRLMSFSPLVKYFVRELDLHKDISSTELILP